VWQADRSQRAAWLVFAVTAAEAGLWFGAFILPLVAMMESRQHDSQSTTLPLEWRLFAGAVATGLGVYVVVAGTVAFASDRSKWASLAGLVLRLLAALFLGAVWATVAVRLPCE
jgi:tellurite resistance protein TehA-like permease